MGSRPHITSTFLEEKTFDDENQGTLSLIIMTIIFGCSQQSLYSHYDIAMNLSIIIFKLN